MRNGFSQFSLLCLLCGLASTMPGGPARSQDGTPGARTTSDANELLLLDEPLVVTASKTPQHISDSPAPVTVITEEEIRSSGATRIADLLRSVPGVDVMEPNESQENVSIRGFNQLFANKLLVMVDGRSIYQDTYGVVFWNTEPLLLSRVKRIEVVRGPGSVLYGANAFGGVINIITKTPAEMAAATAPATFTGAAGERHSLFSEATYSGGKAQGWAYTLGAGYHGTNGFGDGRPGQVKDSARVPILTADLQKCLPHGSLQLSANNSDAKADLSSQTQLPDAAWHTGSVSLSYAEDQSRYPVTARAFGNFLRIAADGFYVSSRTYDLDIQQQRTVTARQQLVYGGNYRSVGLVSTLIGAAEHGQQSFGVYLQDQYQAGPATSLFAGIRWDRHSIYGSQVSPRLSLVQHLTHEQTLRFSYGTAYRAPTLVETFLDQTTPLFPGLDEKLSGNTALNPEKVASLEAGYRVDLRGGYVGVNVFDNQITDVIQTGAVGFAPSPPFPPGIPTEIMYVNQGKAHAAGLELEGGFPLRNRMRILANYAYQDVKYQHDQPADFSPRNKVNLTLQSDGRSRWTEYLAAHYVGRSTYNNLGSQIPLRAYTRVDARLGYRVGSPSEAWELSLAATNLLDDHHREMPDVPTAVGGGQQSAPQRRTVWAMLGGKF